MALQPPYRVSYKSHVGGPDYQRAAQSVSPVDWAGAAARGAESAQAFRATEQDMEQSAETHAARLPGIEARSGMNKAKFKEFMDLADERVASRRMEYKALEAGNRVDLMEAGFIQAALGELSKNSEIEAGLQLAKQELRNKMTEQELKAGEMAQQGRDLAKLKAWQDTGGDDLAMFITDASVTGDLGAAVRGYKQLNEMFPAVTSGKAVNRKRDAIYDMLKAQEIAVTDDAGNEHKVTMLDYVQHESFEGDPDKNPFIYPHEARKLQARQEQIAQAEALVGPDAAPVYLKREQILNRHKQEMDATQTTLQLYGAGVEPDEELVELLTDKQREVVDLGRDYMDATEDLQEQQLNVAELRVEGEQDPFQWSFGGAPIDQKRWDWRETPHRFAYLAKNELDVWRESISQAANNPGAHGVSNPQQVVDMRKRAEKLKNVRTAVWTTSGNVRERLVSQMDRDSSKLATELIAIEDRYGDADYETRVALKSQSKQLVNEYARSLVPKNVTIPGLEATELEQARKRLEILQYKLNIKTGGGMPGAGGGTGAALGFPNQDTMPEP